MEAVAADEWLTAEEAIAHIAACIWHRKDGTLNLKLPLSMVARARLQNALEDGPVRARGPLHFPHDMPPHVRPHWPVVEIPSAFWRSCQWDGHSGLRNRSTSDFLPWFEATKKELFELWPEADQVPMPTPFDIDWPLLRDVAEAMRQRLDISETGARRRLVHELHGGAIHARSVFESGASQPINKEEWVTHDILSDSIFAGLDSEKSAKPPNQGRESILLRGEDAISLWPRLVISETGVIAPPLAVWTGARPVPTPRSERKSAGVPKAKLTTFIRDHYGAAEARGLRTNRNEALEAAEVAFGETITARRFREAFAKAGKRSPPGRPRNK